MSNDLPAGSTLVVSEPLASGAAAGPLSLLTVEHVTTYHYR